ncbi:MAG: universal stress protein [Burkholderiaceae bacterium]|jgi:nucleotide-binding universal stress UspA family protein|nr:universal stress protein [Burkholderiaceae bacterium]
MKILLAVDGSKYTRKMLAYLGTHEELFGKNNEYVIFNVQSPLPLRARTALGKDVIQRYYQEEAERVLAPVLKYLQRHSLKVRSDWKIGEDGETIARYAESGKFELAVMGSHGQGALASLVMGSVATRVLANCKVPVLLVR